MSNRPPVKTILILAANPIGEARLRLDEEVREIDTGLRLARQRDQFVLHQRWAVRPKDIRRALFDAAPQIVHFCGHGEGTKGLMVENESGKMQSVSTKALADFFRLFDKVECVLLNACYSEVQAEAISQHIPYVIGMSHAIGDQAAIEFAIGFYDALGYGRSYEDAYRFGCNAIDLQGIPEEQTPKIKRRRTKVSTSEGYFQRPPAPRASIPSASQGESQPRKSFAPRSHSTSRRSTASSPDYLLTLSKKIWGFLLAIVVIWIIVGIIVSSSKIADAPGINKQIGLFFCGAIGGLCSGLLGAMAQRRIRSSVQLEQILLQCIIGTIAGCIGWLVFYGVVDSVTPGAFIRNSSTFGVIAGLGAAGLKLWQLSRSRA